MSGLRKAKKYDWKDSNMALFGTDVEKGVKKDSANEEKAWHGCGQKVGLKIWRINKFKIEDWPEEDYGKFFEGDSYIVLNTYKKSEDNEALYYDLHFWIGRYSTQDEYGTAAYKTVELDTFLDDKPVQHREVQAHESKLFKSYFKSMTTMKGGADTGFKRVPIEAYVPRLLRFQKTGRKIVMTELAKKRENLNEGDVFILDLGNQLVQWNGSSCNQMEKYEAAQEMNRLKTSRLNKGDIQTRIYEQGDLSEGHRFYQHFDKEDDDDNDENDDDDDQEELEGGLNLVKVSDEDGSIGMEEVPVDERALSPSDVYLIHKKEQLYVWCGLDASIDERRNAFSYAHNYLQSKNCPYLGITVCTQGEEPSDFKENVDLPIAA